MTKNIQRIEGFFIFLLCIFAYFKLDGNWLLFILLLFTPDISMIGYLRNNKIGAYTYNLMHNYALAIVLILVGFIFNQYVLLYLGLILGAHVGLDRTLKYGLKKVSGFKDTHLGKLKGKN